MTSFPKIIIFADGVTSLDYTHAADIVIKNGQRIKDRQMRFGPASEAEMYEAVIVTKEMADRVKDERRRWAQQVVETMTAGKKP